MNSKLLEVAKKARQLNRVPSAIVNKRREEERKKKAEEWRKRYPNGILAKDRKINQLTGLQDIGAPIPANTTPINIVQKPNGKVVAEVPKPSPQESRKKREQSKPKMPKMKPGGGWYMG